MRKINLWALCLFLLVIYHPVLSQTRIPIDATVSAGGRLVALGIDTTNLTQIMQIATNPEEPYSAGACLFLAQRGSNDILPTLKSRFHQILGATGGFPIDYLAGLYVLGDAETHSLAQELVDAMASQENIGVHRYSSYQWVEAIEFLLAYGDYSRYELFASLFVRQEGSPDEIWIQDFSEFAKDGSLRPRVYQKLKDLLASPNEGYRRYALLVLAGFTDFADLKETYRSAAINDPSDRLKVEAVSILMREYSDSFALTALETIAKATGDTTSFLEAVHMIKNINAPEALIALKRIAQSRPVAFFHEEIALELETYWPPRPADSLALASIIDSLTSRTPRVANLGWLAGNNFTSELLSTLQLAHDAIVSGDQIDCARAIRTFQEKVDAVYRDSLNSDPRFVTIDGWKFLYHSARYMLARLPQIPPSPELASLTPLSATAGSTGFTLNIKGTSFVSSSVVVWNGSSRTTSFIADSLLQATILTSDLATARTVSVAVVNPGKDTSNVLPFTITQPPTGLNVKLINSTGTNLTGGSLQYYDGSWKDATNNNDGTFSITTSLKTLSLRMTYEFATQTKSNVTVGYDTVAFQTVNTQVKLQSSQGVPIDTGTVQYYFSAWKPFGTTTNGIASKELLPGSYTFRMTYASATNDKQQDIGTNPVVLFQTVNASVQLKNSQGALMDQGTVQYYFSSWNNLGNTANGIATKELLPGNYTFRMTYAAATNDKLQNIGTNPTVIFQTVNTTVQLQNSLGSPIDQGTVQYYFSSWNNLGATTNGVPAKELLPGSYTFRMTYEFATNEKQQNIGTNPAVVFQTVNAMVQLRNSQGAPIDTGRVQYYFSAWKELGVTSNGVAVKELLPANYTFRMTHESVTNEKAQNISTNNTVAFSTVLCTVRVKNSQNQPVNGALASYYFSAWRQIGPTANGEITKELLPANLTFRITLGTVSQDKAQNIATSSLVEFVTQ